MAVRQRLGRTQQGVIMHYIAAGERLITVHHVRQFHHAVAHPIPGSVADP
jgi:hypothetical protein